MPSSILLRATLTTCALSVCAAPSFAQCPQTTGPDVIVGDVGGSQADTGPDGVSDYTNVGNIDAFSVGTYSCNIGTMQLQWIANSANHPVIPQHLYRMKTVDGATRFEQIGLSWMKHGFFALSENFCCNNCQPTGGSALGIGCSDPYTPARNGAQVTTTGGLGPRFQVNPHTGAFVWPYMFRGTTAGIGNNSITRRLQVHVDDLNPTLNAGAQYFFEAQYVTPDDAAWGHQDNNASYRRGTITGTNPNYSASMAGFTTVREKPAITAWKTADPTVTETIIDTPEATGNPPANDTTGRAYLSAKATDLGNGMWHYEYALYNMNSDRAFDGFSIPVPAGANVTNIGFHDVFYHSGDGFNSTTANPVTFDGTDWPGVFSGGEVSWDMVVANPAGNSNALRWGTLYNFRFDCDVPPTSGNATIDMFKAVAGQPDSIAVATVVPTPSEGCLGDVDGNGAVDVDDLIAVILGWGPCGKSCPGDVNSSGAVDVDDLITVILAWGACN